MKDKRKIISLLFIFMALNCFCGVSYDANGVPHSTYEPSWAVTPAERFDNPQSQQGNPQGPSGTMSGNSSGNSQSQAEKDAQKAAESEAEAEAQRATEEAQRKAAEEQARIEALKKEKENAIAVTTRELLEYESVVIEAENKVKELYKKLDYEFDKSKIPSSEYAKIDSEIYRYKTEIKQRIREETVNYEYHQAKFMELNRNQSLAIQDYIDTVGPLVQNMETEKTVGDPVDVTTGQYLCYFGDNVIERNYKHGRKGILGKNWISNLDTRIVRCKMKDYSEAIKDLTSCKEAATQIVNEINQLKEKYSDITEFDQKLETYKSKIKIYDYYIFLYSKIGEYNSEIEELNKFVSYDLFENSERYTISYEYIIFVDENGNSIYCKFSEDCYEPLEESLKGKIKIYGRNENGEKVFEDENSGGFIVEYSDGSKKYFSKYGQLEKIKYKNQKEKKFFYNKSGQLERIKLETNENLLVVTNENGYISKIEGPVYGSSIFNYSNGKLSFVKDSDDISLNYKYDSGNYLNEIVRADGSSVKIQYENHSILGVVVSKVINELGEEELYEYDFSDDNNRKTYFTSISGQKFIYYSNAEHQITKIVESNGGKKEFSYNDAGLYDSITENGEKRKYNYNVNQNTSEYELKSIQFDDGSTYSVDFDKNGNLIEEIDRDGNIYQWNYDEYGNQTESFYNGQKILSAIYNSNGQIKTLQDDRFVISFEYNQYGEILKKETKVDGKSIIETWNYDAKNRPIKYENSNGDFTIIEYGENYQKENYNNKKLIERFYNLRKWEIKTIESDLSTGVKYTKELVYDSCKRLKHILINGKKLASYTYKSGGMLKSYTSWSIDGGGYTTEYVYNQSNQIVSEIVYAVGKDGIPIGKKYTLYTRDFEKSNENSKYEKTLVTEKTGYMNPELKEYDNQGRLIFNRKPDGYEKNYTYSKAGKLLKESDSNSVVRNYVFERNGSYSILETNSQNNSAYEKYDKYFRLIEYKSFANEVFKYDYDAYGNVIKETAANYSKVYDYDLKNRLVKSRLYDSSGECISQTEYVYDQEKNLVQVFENSKLIKSKTLDAFGRVIEVNDKRGKTVFYYNEFGNITKKTDELGKNTYFEYNPYGDVKKIKDDFGNTTEYEYFPTGDIKAFFENGKKICEYTYDDCFNLTKVENQFSEINYEYDKTGVVNSLTKNESGTTKFQKGSDNRSLFITNSMNQKYEYFLDKNGNLSQIKNPLGKVQSFEYDKKNRVIEKKWNSGKITKYSYDDNANVIIKQNILNYKNKSNETEINQKKQAEVIIKKNALGQIIRAQNENSDLHFEYDFSGNLSKYNDKKNGITIEYFYDDFNRLVKKESDSFDFEYLYDSLSRLVSVNEKFHGVSAHFEYDNCSREVFCTLSNGNTIETIYDDFGRKTAVITRNRINSVIQADLISYDEKNRIQGKCDEKGNLTIYEYDSKSRVICEKKSYSQDLFNFYKLEALETGRPFESLPSDFSGVNEAINNQIIDDFQKLINENNLHIFVNSFQKMWNQNYVYNEIGSLVSSENFFGKIIYEYDSLNRVVKKYCENHLQNGIELVWNDDGLLEKINAPYNKFSFEYGTETRPVKIQNVDFVSNKIFTTNFCYDALGRRYLKSDENGSTTSYIYDGLSCNLLVSSPMYQNDVLFLTEKTFEANYDESVEYKLINKTVDEDFLDVKTMPLSSKKSTFEAEDLYDSSFKYSDFKNEFFDSKGNIEENENYSENRPFVIMRANGKNLLNLYSDSYVENFELLLRDCRGSVTGSSDSYSDVNSICDYDCWGNPIVNNKNIDFNSSLSVLNSDFVFYDLGFRDYSPIFKCFTSEDPAQDGMNWYAYCSGDPINFIDDLGLTREELTKSEQLQFEYHVTLFAAFDKEEYKKNNISAGIPKGYDCADVSSLVNIKANNAAGIETSSEKLKEFEKEHERLSAKSTDNSIGKNYKIATVDFIKDTEGNNFRKSVEGYSYTEKWSRSENRTKTLEMLSNPDNVSPGSVMMWRNPNNPDLDSSNGWTGHAATVLAREFDSNGNVRGVIVIQGHTNGTSTELSYISFKNGSAFEWNNHLDVYAGDFYGMYAIEKKLVSEKKCAK